MGVRLALVLVAALLTAACSGSSSSPPDLGGPDVAFDWGGRVDLGAPDVPVPDLPVDTGPPPCEVDADCVGLLAGEGPCREARCEAASQRCQLVQWDDGEACDSGNACFAQAVCASGLCVVVEDSRLSCDDENSCTEDSCDPDLGCVHEPNNRLCDDGRACTEGDRCADGVCQGRPVVCDDLNPCTSDVCREPDGCRHTANQAPCDDNNLCTENDFCSNSECQRGTPVDCDDGNPCTNDSCQSRQGCRNAPNVLPCDDGNPCTVGDTCADGACVPGAYLPTCPSCVSDFDCRPYDDGNPCNGVIACVSGQCRVITATIVHCPPPSDPCLRARCAPESGRCVEEPRANGTACDDGDRCTLADACVAGVCVGQPASCDDGNECTADSCDSEQGCLHAPNDGAPCEDGDPCTGGDTCEGALCVPGPDYLCVPCEGEADCEPLQDGDLCNGVLRCIDGGCQLDPASIVTCDTSSDGPCRRTVCLPETGTCVVEDRPDGTWCDDEDICTSGDACLAGVCAGNPLVCDDADPCTNDFCDRDSGTCIHVPQMTGEPCDDGNLCTVGDQCVGGVCIPGPVDRCDDDNPCTDDSCVATEGCVFTPNSLACDDGRACTVGDTCVEGLCVGTPVVCDDGEVCTQDACDEDTGSCTHTAVAGPCDDGEICTVGDSCSLGRCVPGPIDPCDDGNGCTAGRCVAGEGCVYELIPGVCDDGDPCTTGDRCVEGVCVGDGVLSCDDGNVCTDDVCVPGVGCVYEPNTAPCDDGDACTQDDTCVDTRCVGGGPVDCDDDNVCTDDGCLPSSGCTHVYNTSPCDDGNPCTEPDFCNSGRCVPGPIVCTESDCGDGIDNDTDGATDCDDEDCFSVSPCLPCQPAEEITCGQTFYGGSLLSPFATDEVADYSCDEGDYSGAEYAYVFRPTCLASVRLLLETSTRPSPSTFLDLGLFVLEDEAERCDPRRCTKAGVRTVTAAVARTELTFPALFNSTYYVVVDGREGDVGPYTLYVECTPVTMVENCTNRVDDDCDGLVDCEDPDCAWYSGCR